MADSVTMADVITLTVKAALAPVQMQLATLTERCAQLASVAADVPALRERLAVAEARPPVPGPPGPTGTVTASDLTVTQDADDPRLLTFGLKSGGTWGTVALPTTRYCGQYKGDRTYTLGDQTTHQGSLWTCTAANPSRPGGSDSGWQLTVKQGAV